MWYGASLFALSLLLPVFVNSNSLCLVSLLTRALEESEVAVLLDACVRLVVMNTLRAVPIYLGAMTLADVMRRGQRGAGQTGGAGAQSERKAVVIKRVWGTFGYILVPVCVVPLVYWLIQQIYGITYDFRMPAVLSILAVVATLGISGTRVTRSRWKAVVIVTELLFGFQWLDIVPFLTGLGFGHGELSWDVKAAAEVLGAAPLLNTFALIIASAFIANGVITAKFMVDYHELLRLSEVERARSVEIERMKSEAALARNYREMHALMHDLRTPLTTIQGLASAMADFPSGSPVVGRHARQISLAADRMDMMIRELMSGGFMRRLSGREVADRLAAHLPEEKTGGRVRIEVGEALPDVMANEVRLVRALTNLTDNAIDAGAKSVTVRFDRCGDDLSIIVTDDGEGMSADVLERCFEEGYSTKGSTGMGLAFVRQVVTEHGGTVTIASSEGLGTRCRIVLPGADRAMAHESQLVECDAGCPQARGS